MKMPDWVTQDILQGYDKLVHDTVRARILIVSPIGAAMHMAFSFLDYLVYPQFAPLFLKVRIFDSVVIMLLWGLSVPQKTKRHNFFFIDAAAVLTSAGINFMIYKTDGTYSHYYEGINLVVLALLLCDGFSTRHNLITCLIMLLCYAVACLANPTYWDLTKFVYANFFIGSTAFFVVLMTKFYSAQHFDAFIRNEAVKRSEKELQRLYLKAEEMSKTDELTQISNRRHFFEILDSKISATEASSGPPFYLIIFDIDYFKRINDQHGHMFGDQVIEAIAQTVKNNIRPSDRLGRYGGDEFMMIFNKAAKEDILRRLTGISHAIQEIPLSANGTPVMVSASFGAARFEPGRGVSAIALIEAADRELLNVKQTKRGEIGIGDA